MTLDLSILPPERRDPVIHRYWRERAAVRIREVYPHKIQRYNEARAFDETAAALRRENEHFAFVSARYVQAVMREGR